jgi:REP element-mobilizing transposase RayT
MNRGRRGEEIYLEKDDYVAFIDLLQESAEMFNVRIAAYCLMPNHYHVLIQTPDANLSRFMRHLNGVYTQRFNRSHKHDGQLFRGRYRSILVDQDSYLLELVRYIHRNPLTAALEETLGRYPWTSHKGYISSAKKWDWLHKDFILAMFSEDKSKSMKRYKQFVSEEDTEEIAGVFESIRLPPILGSERFVEWVKKRFFDDKYDREIPQSKSLAPSVEQIKTVICEFYGIDEKALLISKRGSVNEPRNLAIYFARRLRGDGLDTIAKTFNVRAYSSVSSVVNRTQILLSKNRKLRKSRELINFHLIKGQAKT